jgi:hypothetical protein
MGYGNRIAAPDKRAKNDNNTEKNPTKTIVCVGDNSLNEQTLQMRLGDSALPRPDSRPANKTAVSQCK